MKVLRLKLFYLILFLAFSQSLKAQVKALSLAELEQRFEARADSLLIVNFWATWCAPCVEELPYFDALSRQNNLGIPLKVLLVSVDFKSKLEKEVVPFLKKKALSAEVVLLDERDQQLYIDRIDKSWSGAVPATLIFYKDKRYFYEQEFTPETLHATILKIINPQ